MASLRYSQIRVHPEGTINYIANQEKMISPKSHDVHNVLSYMGEPEGIERVYSFSRNCSANPRLAAAQIELGRTRYYNSKVGGIQGLKEGNSELLGLHFFVSFTEEDNPSESTMDAITKALSEHPLIRDFPFFSAKHFDRTHRHIHIFVSQYSADEGKPRKLCMRYNDYNDLRKYLNRLCVAHSLSIIDLPALRHNDVDYSAWIDSVIAEGKVTIHPESKEHQGARRQRASTKQIYYKRLKEAEEFNQQEEARLTAAQLRSKKAKATYFWSFDNSPATPPYRISTEPTKRYHAVKRYDANGRERSLIELICMLVITIYRSEMRKHAQSPGITGQIIQARTDRNVQAMMDSLRLSREMNISTPDDITARLSDCGRQMNGLKSDIHRLEESLQAPQPRDGESLEQLQIRQQFQLKKLDDYERRMTILRRQYRGLKKLQSLVSHADRIAQQVYLCHPVVSLDTQIRAIQEQKVSRTNDNLLNNENHHTRSFSTTVK